MENANAAVRAELFAVMPHGSSSYTKAESTAFPRVPQETPRPFAEDDWPQQALVHMPVACVVCDADIRAVFWNHAAEAMFGFSASEVLGKRLDKLLVPAEAQEHVADILQRLSSGDVNAHSVNKNITKDGCLITCEWHNVPLIGADGKVFGLLSIVQNITARLQTEDLLNQSKERLRLVADVARMGAWNWDIQSGQFSLSQGMGPVFGLPGGEGPRTPMELLALVHPADREIVAKAMVANSKNGIPVTIEYRTVWPDKSIHWVEAHSNVILNSAGKPAYGVGVALDITRRKRDAATIHRTNRALATLIAVNEELVRAPDEMRLLQAVCRAIVEKGGYCMVSVGYAEHDMAKTLKAMAWAGVEDGYLSGDEQHTWADTPMGQKPIARAIRSGKPALSQNIQADTGFQYWKAAATERNYVSNLALPLSDGECTFGALSIYASELEIFDPDEMKLLEKLAADLGYGIAALRVRTERDRIDKERLLDAEKLKRVLEDSIQAIAATVEMRDPYTAGHQKRVAELAAAIAREMGFSDDAVHGIHLAGVVHDLGKIHIPAEILSKPGKLSEIEYLLMKTHPKTGYEILKDIEFPWPIATVVLQHHERWDGSGYPQGLKGEQILPESRIMAVADVVESMASHRPYRASLGIGAALSEIERGRNTAYDPAVVDACMKLFDENRFKFQV